MESDGAVTLRFEGRALSCGSGETVLEAFERQGVPLPSSCRSGTCQTCLLQATEGGIPPAAQAGLKPAWRELGYLLACVCRPEQGLSLQVPGEGIEQPAVLVRKERLDERVVRLMLRPLGEMSFRAGQFIHLSRADGLTRPYSIASLPSDPLIELHVRVLPDGRMSRWLDEGASVGETLQIRGPSGDCFYLGGDRAQPLLLVGVGTGIAPMWGIAREALSQGHEGPITIVHAAASGRGLYLMPALRELASAHGSVSVRAVAMSADGVSGVIEGDLSARLPEIAPQVAKSRVYLCGDAAIVNALRRQIFLAGASLRHIHADAFVGAKEAAR